MPGFASMDPAKLREISAKGGRASKGGGRKKQGKLNNIFLHRF